jgi:cytochrome b561
MAAKFLAAACDFALFEYFSVSLTSIGYFPFYLTMITPLITAVILSMCDWARGRRPLYWHEYALCSCLVFWTQQPSALIFLIALILVGFIENKRLKLSVKPIGAWAGILAAAVITLPWAVSSFEKNLTWLESGQRIERGASAAAHLMSRIPKGSCVTIVDNAGLTYPETGIIRIISHKIAHRPDLDIRQSKKIDSTTYNIVCDRLWHTRLNSPDD